MAIKQNQNKRDTIYFVTFTCWNWLPLFKKVSFYDAIYKWFDFLKEKKNCKIIAYVIMPNHIHFLIHIPRNGERINKIVANGKRFLAYEMIKRLKVNNEKRILETLVNAVNSLEKKRGKKHRVFTISSDIKDCFSERFIIQKLNYIHNNPIRGKWKLSEDISSYLYSSASYYELGEDGLYSVFDYRDIETVDSWDSSSSIERR